MRAEVLREAVAALLDVQTTQVRCKLTRFGRGARYEIHIAGNVLSLADSNDSWLDAFAVVVEQAHFQWRAELLETPPKEIEESSHISPDVKNLIHKGRLRVKECWDLKLAPGKNPERYLSGLERQRQYYQERKRLETDSAQSGVATQTGDERYSYYARVMYQATQAVELERVWERRAQQMQELVAPWCITKAQPKLEETEETEETEEQKEARLEAIRLKLEQHEKEKREREEREARIQRRRMYEDAYARAPTDEFVLASGESSLHIRRLMGKARLRGLMGYDGNGNRQIPRARRLDEYDGDSSNWG